MKDTMNQVSIAAIFDAQAKAFWQKHKSLSYFAGKGEEQHKFFELKGAELYLPGFEISPAFDKAFEEYCFFNQYTGFPESVPEWARTGDYTPAQVAAELDRRLTEVIRQEHGRLLEALKSA